MLPRFTGNAFLGGTKIADAPKWLFSSIIRTGRHTFGCLGPKSMEVLQNGFHLVRSRFLSFLTPRFYVQAKWLFPLIMACIVIYDRNRAFAIYRTFQTRYPALKHDVQNDPVLTGLVGHRISEILVGVIIGGCCGYAVLE